MLTTQTDIEIAVLAVYVIALAAVFFARNTVGRVNLLAFCALKVVGAALIIAATVPKTLNGSLYVWGIIISTIGYFTLLNFYLQWVKGYFYTDVKDHKLWRLLRLVFLAGIVLYIIGASEGSNGMPDWTYLQVADLIAFVLSVGLAILVIVGMKMPHSTISEKHRKHAGTLLLLQVPFMLVRTIGITVIAFQKRVGSVWVDFGVRTCTEVAFVGIALILLYSIPMYEEPVRDTEDAPTKSPV